MGCSERSTPGLHADMHGVSAHMMHAAAYGSIMGVPAASRKRAGACTIAPTGHAAMHSLQRVHPLRKATSSTAPGGRCTGRAKVRPTALGAGRLLRPDGVESAASLLAGAPWNRRPKSMARLESRGSSLMGECLSAQARPSRRREHPELRRSAPTGRTPRPGRGTGRSSSGRGDPDASHRTRTHRDN